MRRAFEPRLVVADRCGWNQQPVLADARDFDDAIDVEKLPKGGWRLGVHIADVAAYVEPGTALDREARLRVEQQAARTLLAQLDTQIEQEFPQYRELTDPRPLSVEAARV